MCPDRAERAVFHALLSGFFTGLVFLGSAAIAIAVVRARREKSESRHGRQRRKRAESERIWIHPEADRRLRQPPAPESHPLHQRLRPTDAIRAMCRATASFASPREWRTAWPT